ncbi:MAG: 30S ribosomal protein S2 [Bacteroidetes bacterium]|jgi:small subunit ribosomal protein S2|nr:30S ribosomal protein S2 [Bacteroidota bacterium]MBL0256760.1 30S ribosomal protein S2 [Bacteroidota bacterium]MBP6402818.1 30S ribosomal protein S2 [Bacteroidia bacterium]MBP6649979.1 30S ribosomal protein S2 [Bacteroidia bacterium]
MSRVSYNDLLEAGAHFGHLKSKWNPKMAPYIFMEARGIHIIDLNKTVAKIDEAANAMKQIAKSGKKVLFVATKKQAKEIVSAGAEKVNMPFITERWPGGMLTNFATVRKSVKKMTGFEKMATDGTFDNISKKERLQITRQKAKMEKFLGSISDLSRLPAALFIVDINKEHIAVAEAQKLNIPTFAITDTNTDPTQVDFAIPANDDATKSIALIVDTMVSAIEEGLAERKVDKEMEKEKEEEETAAGLEKVVAAADDEEETEGGKPAAPKAGATPRKRTTNRK